MPLRPFRERTPQARQVAAGGAVRELFEQHGQMVHAVCRLNLRDRLDAEDATQQTFLSAYRSLLGGGEPTNPPAWLATIARNECSRVRKRRIVTVPIDDSEGAEGGDVASAVERREEIEALVAALSELAPSQRDAVVLREFYGLSYEEVAAALGVSGPAAESLLFKGRRRLQEKLGSLRVAGVVVLPDTLRDALAQALPGFGGGGAAAASAKVIAFPVVAKVAAVAVIVTGGGVTVADTVRRDIPRPTVSAVTPETDSAPQLIAPNKARPRITLTPAAFPAAQGRHEAPRARTRAAVHEDEREVAEREDGRKEEDEVTEREERSNVAEREDRRSDEEEVAEGEGEDTEGSDADDTLDD